MAEKRRSPRKHLRYPALIDVGDGSPMQMCSLVDISDTGARMNIDASHKVANQFTLFLGHESGARRRCRVAWRNAIQIGVEFLKAEATANKPVQVHANYKDR